MRRRQSSTSRNRSTASRSTGRDPVEALHNRQPADRIKKPAIENENVRIFGSGRCLGLLKNLRQSCARGPDVEVRILFIPDRTNRRSFDDYLDTKAATFQEGGDLSNRAGLACLWRTSELNDNGLSSAIESCGSSLTALLQMGFHRSLFRHRRKRVESVPRILAARLSKDSIVCKGQAMRIRVVPLIYVSPV
jgi:hypothetical protein